MLSRSPSWTTAIASAERRVTVLFTDIAGFTETTDLLDDLVWQVASTNRVLAYTRVRPSKSFSSRTGLSARTR